MFEMAEGTEKPPDEIKWFECSACGMKEEYHFKREKPKLFKGIVFSSDCYIMKDPFTSPEKKQFIVLGSDCCICKKPVCQANDCSLFYKERFCQNCAWQRKTNFPEQLHGKIKDPSKG